MLKSELPQLEERIEAEGAHADALTQALHERDETMNELRNERQYVLDNVARLEENLRQRDADISNLSRRIVERESDAEELRESLNKALKDRSRDVDEQVRALQEVTLREGEARSRMESLVMQKAESDVLVKTLQERVAALNEELERLRRQVHDLQQGSADKEVRLTQFGKWRDQDKEDIRGLNIALDSKQQELELVSSGFKAVSQHTNCLALVEAKIGSSWNCR
jgi:chromosome segregation ATPase